MNILRKELVIIGAVLAFLGYPTPATAALRSFVWPHYKNPQPGNTPQLKYYRLELLNDDKSLAQAKKDGISPATLSDAEVEQMKAVLQKSIRRYNLTNRANPELQITGQYGVQYQAYIDKRGRKQIWINGFCAGNEMYQKPETEVVAAFDGGSCFFNTTIRCGSSKVFSIGIHGSA